jgi:hypothetical protein
MISRANIADGFVMILFRTHKPQLITLDYNNVEYACECNNCSIHRTSEYNILSSILKSNDEHFDEMKRELKEYLNYLDELKIDVTIVYPYSQDN